MSPDKFDFPRVGKPPTSADVRKWTEEEKPDKLIAVERKRDGRK